jgi:putative transposase
LLANRCAECIVPFRLFSAGANSDRLLAIQLPVQIAVQLHGASAPAFHVEGDTLLIFKLGGFRFQTHRQIRGVAKHLTVVRTGKKWRASVVCDTGPEPEKKPVRSAVGVDMGVHAFATLSDGTQIDNPRWLKRAEEKIASCHRALARKMRGSKNRMRAKGALGRAYLRVSKQRRNFTHHISKWLVSHYDLIAFEKLDIARMVRGDLAKSILDAAWGQLLRQVAYKAAEAGAWAVPVAPKNTTQACSCCGQIVPKKLSHRWHRCDCGLSIHRDLNAARNILALGRSAAGLTTPEVLN